MAIDLKSSIITEIILATIKINYGNYGRIMALQIRRRSFIKRGNYGKQL